MPNEILYHLPDGTAIYRGEKPPSDRELHRDPESYKLGEIGSRLNREMAAEFAAGGD